MTPGTRGFSIVASPPPGTSQRSRDSVLSPQRDR